MFEDLKKTFEKGMDFAFQTKDKIEKAAKDFARENNLNAAEAKKLMEQWQKKSEEVKKNLEKQIADIQKKTIEKMNLVTKDDLKKLEARLKKLEGKPKPPAKKKSPSKPTGKAAQAK